MNRKRSTISELPPGYHLWPDGVARRKPPPASLLERTLIAELRPSADASEPITVTVAIRTVSEANSHQHWRERQRRAKAQRQAAFAAVPFCVRHLTPPLRITLTRLAPRRLDSDNLAGACKAIRDGVADALGIDDGDSRLDWQYDQRKASEYGIEIVIQRVEG